MELLQFLMPTKLMGYLLKPLVRLVLGLIAIPLCKLFLRRVVRMKDLSAELEKDIAQWVRGSLMLLVASSNMESFFFGWVPLEWREDKVVLLAARLLLAIGVVEAMPDQALFSIIHPGPPPLKLERGKLWASLIGYIRPFLKGLICQHLNRSSPVFAILTVFLTGPVGWICYGLAITNYLIIGLVSSKDKALNVLQQFDAAVAERRKELLSELQSDGLTPEQRVAIAERGGPFPPPMESLVPPMVPALAASSSADTPPLATDGPTVTFEQPSPGPGRSQPH
jgi:hypothetical protein